MTTDIYFAVPDHYTIGTRFATYREAEAYARSTIVTFDYGDESGTRDSRAFIDVREVDAEGDRPIRRIEVFHQIERS